MRHLLPLHILLVFFVVGSTVKAERIKRLSGDPKPRLTAAQVKDLEQQESKEHPVEGYVSVSTIVDCFDEMSYRYTGGRYQEEEIKFRLRSPNKIKSGKKYPLIVWFHGKGEGDDDNKRQLAHMQNTIEYLAGPKSLDFFVLATQCPKDNRSWTTSMSSEDDKGDAPITITREIMEAVIEEYPVDENRISAFGLSSGGGAAWRFVMDSPERFSALAVCSAPEPQGQPLVNMNVWIFACTGDNGVPVDSVRQSVTQMNNAGGSALLTELNVASHDSWTEALNRKKIFAWLISQKKESYSSPPPGAVLTPKTWKRAFVYYGLPLFCMFPFLIVQMRKKK